MPSISIEAAWIPLAPHIGRDVMTREARTKNGFAPRICAACGRPFEWRKKWARDWENVRWCSVACRQRGG